MAKFIIRIGQSNMAPHETTANLQAGYKQTYTAIQTWNGSAYASLDWTTNNNGYPQASSLFSGVFSLLSKIQAHWGETIYDIKLARGGTYLGTAISPSVNWNTATQGSYYDELISTINNALAYAWNTLGIREYDFYIFYCQGESDTRSTTDANNFETNYTNIVNGVRDALAGSVLSDSKKYWITLKTNTNIKSSGDGATITGATNASPIKITTSAVHSLITGMQVNITGVTGNTAANGSFPIIVTSTTEYTLTGSTGDGAYISGGEANSWSLSSTVNTAQENVTNTLLNCYSVNCEAFSLTDFLHYDATGYDDLGDAGANVIINNNL